MTKRTISSLFSIVAISALTIGCGSSSTTPKNPTVAQTTGTVIDDYIEGADVCVDSNKDGKLDKTVDTQCAITNATGQFTFATDESASPLVMSGGTDVASKKPFTGTYTAPAGSTVINPLTTIVQAIVLKDGTSITDAQATVKISLGLPTNVDLTTYDPIAALNNPTTVEDAKTVFAQQSSIQTILTTIAATIAASASGTTTKEAAVTNSAATQIATLMTAATTAAPIDVASAENVKKIITGAATTENVTVDTALVTAVATQVNLTSVQVIKSIDSNSTNISDIRVAAAQISTVVQENVATATTAIEAGTSTADIADTLNAIDATALTASIAAVTIDTTNLTTVATVDTQPVVTGGEGGN